MRTVSRSTHHAWAHRAGTALVTAVICGAMAACSGGNANNGSTNSSNAPSAPSNAKTLTVALGPISSNAAGYKKFYAALAKTFKQQTGATLKLEYTETSETVEDQMIDEAAVAKSGPDLIFLGTTVFPTAYFSNGFVSLSPANWEAIGGEGQFYPGELGLSGPNSKERIGIPLYNVPDAMAYNTKLFKAAGIPKPPTTWNEFIADAQKITNPKKGVYGTGMDPADDTDPWKTLWFMVKQLGGGYVAKDNKTAVIDSKAVETAVTFWFDWLTKFHIVDPNSLTWQSTNMEAAFAKGDIGELIVQKASDVPLFKAGAVGNNFAFAPIPSVPYGMESLPPGGSAPGTFLSGDGVGITRHAPLTLALDFVKIWLSNDMQVLQYRLTGELPVTKSAGTVVEALDPAINGPFIASLKTQEPTPFVQAWGTVEDAMHSVSQSVSSKIASSGTFSPADVKTALKAANSSVQQQLPTH